MDTYQAIYDATRSRMSNGDIGAAIESSMRDSNISFYFEQMKNFFIETIAIQSEPFFLIKPNLFIEGDMWCALYGVNLQEGVAGFGKSPAEAVQNFNNAWYEKIN